MRIALIPEVIGIVQNTITKFGNEDLGKYENNEKSISGGVFHPCYFGFYWDKTPDTFTVNYTNHCN